MAIVYFTNNASSGSGSLVDAVANAQPGDVVRPDESVFERGSIIEIALASSLDVDKNLTLDGGPFRVRLNGGGSVACVVATGFNVSFMSFDFIDGVASSNGGGLRVESGAHVVLTRCRACGCDAAQYGGGVYVGDSAMLTVNNSAIFGNRAQFGGGIYIGDSAAATLNGATVCGNVDANAGLDIDGETSTSALASVNSILGNAFDDSETLGSIVGVTLSSVGFVAPPPDGLTFESWDANAWQNWNLHLLDDASGAPSPYRDSGDVVVMSRYDLDGNVRGREVNGASSCSPGAYETIQAEFFWVGVDSTGAAVASPAWNVADGWAASRFATVSGDAAPPTTAVVFVDGSPTFAIDSFRVGSLIVGGGSSIGINNTSGTALTLISTTAKIGVGATFRSVSGTSRFQTAGSLSVWEFADYTYFPQQFFFGSAQGLKISPTSQFATVVANAKLYANGVYNNYNWQISGTATVEDGANGANNIYITFQNLNARIASIGSPRVSANTIKWTIPTGATSDYTALTDGSTPIIFAPRNTFEVFGIGSTNDFIVDVANAGSTIVTLSGQTVYGNASSGSVSLIGVASVGASGLTVGALTLADGATVAFSDDASLIANSVALDGASTATGSGTFFVPTTAPAGLTLESGALWANTNAGVTSVNVVATSATTVEFSVVKTNGSANIVAQSSENGAAWTAVETTASSTEYELTVTQGAEVAVRVASPTGWLISVASTVPFLPIWTVSNASEVIVGVSNVFEVVTGGSNTGDNSIIF